MATIIFRGDALDVAQVSTHTVGGTPANGQVYTVSVNGKTAISYTATVSDTNPTIATALKALLAASTIPEIKEATYTVSTNVITSTSAKAGVPYTFTTAATGTGTFVTATTTSAAGHEFWSDATNWSLARIPAGECSPPVQADATASAGGSLGNGTTYYWVITATNANGESLKSNEKSLAITAPDQTANLSWAAVPGATGFKVYRSTSAGNYTDTLLATISSGSTLTYVDTGGATGAGTPPVSNTAVGDDIYMSQSASSVKYGLPSDYLVPNSLHVDSTYIGQGGLPDLNPAGYYEYRQTYLKMAPKSVFFGENGGSAGGSGSTLFRIDKGTANTVAFLVYQTGNPSTQGLPAFWAKGANASDTYVIQQGFVGLAVNAGETARFTTLKIGYQTSPPTDVFLTIGSGTTCGDITQLGGSVNCNANVSTLTMTSGSQGTFALIGSSTMGTATLQGGTYLPKTTGNHTTVTLSEGGKLDHSQDIRSFNLTTLNLHDGCTFLDPAGTIKGNGGGNLIATLVGNAKNMTLDFGSNKTLTIA